MLDSSQPSQSDQFGAPADHETPPPERSRGFRGVSPWALLLVVSFVVAGGVIAALGHWRRGSVMIGGSAVLAAALRAFLPERLAGLLVVRRRWLDVTITLVMGLGIIVLAMVVPPKQ